MPKRAREGLRRQELNLYDGDYEELRTILAPKKISPGEYIRELVRRQIRFIQDNASVTNKTPEPINDDELLAGLSPQPGVAE